MSGATGASVDAVERHRGLRRYVLADENVVLAVRRHWARLAEPAITAVVALAVGAVLAERAQAAVGDVGLVVLWLGLLPTVRLVWRLLEWRVEWFVATDRRMLLLTGLLTHRVAMMPLHKVTDMSYSRSLVGQVLGYGEFVLESAGQDQAMRRIGWVARPDETYRRLCATIFAPGQGRPPGLPGFGAAPAPAPAAAQAASGADLREGVSVAHGEVSSVPDSSAPVPLPPSFLPEVGDTQPLRLRAPRSPEPDGVDEGGPAWHVDGPRTPFVAVGESGRGSSTGVRAHGARPQDDGTDLDGQVTSR
ncbi:PH domain-containing protein [Cellulomonas soli]|uniref:PH domain-containing protein n=1 Tax=Cellulomonas soli TaxID=931535 RepID=UPI003F836D74